MRKELAPLYFVFLLTACDASEPTDAPPPWHFLVTEKDWYVSDGVVGHVHKPDAQRRIPWPEHEKGRILMRTNNLGFREDGPTSPRPDEGAVRVLVTGDSHLDGVLYNEESFPNVLEVMLNEAREGRAFEVINGGAGYYGIEHYARFLRRYLDLEPDLFIVTVFTGNDFLGVAREIEKQEVTPFRPPDYIEKLRAARDVRAGIVSQGLNQLFYMQSLPEMAAETMAVARRAFLEMRGLCEQNRVRFVVVLWPTLVDTQPWLDQGPIAAAFDRLDLPEEDLGFNRKLALEFSQWLEGQGIEVIDLYQSMRSEPEACYWIKDYHLNVRGHRLTAEYVFEHWRAGFKQLGAR